MIFNEAKARCEAKGGRLAEPRNREQFNELTPFVTATVDRFFLGASDLQTEGVWLFNSDSSPVDLFSGFFNANQPNGVGADENCLALRDAGLNDLNCNNPRASICEYGRMGDVPMCPK